MKTVLELEAGISCTIEAGRGFSDELRSVVQRYSVKTAAELMFIIGSLLRGMKLGSSLLLIVVRPNYSTVPLSFGCTRCLVLRHKSLGFVFGFTYSDFVLFPNFFVIIFFFFSLSFDE